MQELASFEMRPNCDDASDFFKLQNQLFVGQSTISGLPNFGLVTEVLGQSVVPIVAHVHGEDTLRCLGTGFFISCSGLLATAAHVITDPIERDYGSARQISERKIQMQGAKIGVMIPINSLLSEVRGYVFREILWSVFLAEKRDQPLPIKDVDLKLSADISLCRVERLEGEHYQPLSIVQPNLTGVGLAPGKLAQAIGYGDMRDVQLSPVGDNATSGEFSFNLFSSSGSILERFPDNMTNREASSPGPCFSASIKLPGGMSGSPIFDDEGVYVHGVVSRGLEDSNGLASFGYGSMLAPSLSLPLKALNSLSVLDLLGSPDHGIGVISAPDM